MSGHGGKQLGYTGQQRLEELVSQSSGSPVLCGPGLSDSKSHSHRWHPLRGGGGGGGRPSREKQARLKAEVSGVVQSLHRILRRYAHSLTMQSIVRPRAWSAGRPWHPSL